TCFEDTPLILTSETSVSEITYSGTTAFRGMGHCRLSTCALATTLRSCSLERISVRRLMRNSRRAPTSYLKGEVASTGTIWMTGSEPSANSFRARSRKRQGLLLRKVEHSVRLLTASSCVMSHGASTNSKPSLSWTGVQALGDRRRHVPHFHAARPL